MHSTSILDIQRSLSGGELRNRGSAEMAAVSKKNAASDSNCTGNCLLAADEKESGSPQSYIA